METDLHRDVKLLRDLVTTLDDAAREQTEGTLEPDLIALAILEDCRRDLATTCAELTNRLAKAMPEKTMYVEGMTFEKHGKKNRTKWDREALLSAVLDSRMADRDTGEFFDETPLDKVLAVWNLGAPRTTVLSLRGIDADQFCQSEWAGYTIQVKQ